MARPQLELQERRQRLAAAVGAQIVRFQETSQAFDTAAAAVLALHREDLPVMTLLLFGGAASVDRLAQRLSLPRQPVAAAARRLLLAGYARPSPGARHTLELTAHARTWVQTIWSPLERGGQRILASCTDDELARIHAFLDAACRLSEAHAARVRAWLTEPGRRPRPHARGGLSPAALARVQVFVEANLHRKLAVDAMAARAGLSPAHFTRAFRVTSGMTPRRFVETRRVERARHLLLETARPLASIALECGFVTQSRLTTVFRRHTGATPAVFRRGLRPRRADELD